jgi:hypothetical protein
MLYDPTQTVTMETKLSNGFVDTFSLGIPKIEKLGEISAVKLIFYWEMDGYNAPENNQTVGSHGSDKTWTWSDTNAYVITELDITSNIISSKKDNWDLEMPVVITLDDAPNEGAGGNGQKLYIKEAGIEIEYKLEKGFEKKVETVEYVKKEYDSMSPQEYDKMYFEGQPAQDRETETIRIVTHTVKESPKGLDYVFIGAKGRKYGSWIDDNSRDNGYNSGQLIQNPIYIIEDVLRTELSLTDSDIDYTTFDAIGNITNGTLGTAFGDSVVDVKFAFSQYKFIDGFSLINKICKQAGLYFFINGEGKATLRQRLRASSYSSADATIDFNDCAFKGFSRTNIGALRNDISINYKYDYGSETTLDVKTATDSTSKSKYSADSKASKFIIDADCIQDATTATNLASSYLDWLKDRKTTIKIDTVRPKYLHLEIGDIVSFSNFPSTLKAYGSAVSGYFIVSEISKKPSGASMKLVEVS